MADALLRHLDLLRAIPRAPDKKDVAGLHRILEAKGYKITRRQLQRDLNTLSQHFSLEADEPGPGSANGWSWARNATPLELPAMDGQTALMLKMLERFIPTLMPPLLLDWLRPHLRRADEILTRGRGSGLARWTDCVRVMPRELPLLPPKFDRAAMRVAYEALLLRRQFKVLYRGRSVGDAEPAERVVHPLGLVLRGNLIYLVCTLWTYTNVVHLALHRMSRAQLLDEPARRPPGFDIDGHIDSGEFQYPVGPMIKLEALFDKGAAAHLAETPLSNDQKITERDDGRVLVTATVMDSQQLEWWLRAFADGVEVRAPEDLRHRMALALRQAAAQYRSRSKA